MIQTVVFGARFVTLTEWPWLRFLLPIELRAEQLEEFARMSGSTAVNQDVRVLDDEAMPAKAQ